MNASVHGLHGMDAMNADVCCSRQRSLLIWYDERLTNITGSIPFMKRVILAATIASFLSFGFIGCAEKAKETKETKISTPGGTTKVTEEKKIEKTGDHKSN